MKIIMENFRCFAGRHEVELAPLTILTGENSSGKTTFLSATSLVLQNRFPEHPQFNDEVFKLGSYGSIASNVAETAKPASTFSLGVVGDLRAELPEMRIVASYSNVLDEPVLGSLEFVSAGFRHVFEGLNPRLGAALTVAVMDESQPGKAPVVSRLAEPPQAGDPQTFWPTFNGLFRATSQSPLPQDVDPATHALLNAVAYGGLNLMIALHTQPIAIAPVRTRPRRTYDEPATGFDAEGAHMPYVLRQLMGQTGFQASLGEYGRNSGLFSDVVARPWGEQPGSPLELLVSTGSTRRNLVDVGYGVSQALPVIVECARASEGALLLLQQPEVHLHPRAQAELGSFFVKVVARQNKRLVVETHSDYVIDRVRQHVARGDLRPTDVSVLYFEKHGSEAIIYPIRLDELGNVLDAPSTYRDFFMREEMNLLTRGAGR